MRRPSLPDARRCSFFQTQALKLEPGNKETQENIRVLKQLKLSEPCVCRPPALRAYPFPRTLT